MQQILLKNCTISANQWAVGRGTVLAGQRIRDLYTQISMVFNRNFSSKILPLVCIQSLTTHSYFAGSNPPLAGAPARGKQVCCCTRPLVGVLPCQVRFAGFVI